MKIREIDKGEVRMYFECLKKIDQETKFMMFEPDERQYDKNLIASYLSNKDDLFIGAFSEHEIVGFLSAKRGSFRRIRKPCWSMVNLLTNI